MKETSCKISFIIIALNAANTIDGILEDLRMQDFDKKQIEVILVDGSSNDDTKKIMMNFQRKYSQLFYKVMVFDNPKRVLPCGWNIALRNAIGDLILRVDAHTRIPKSFITNNVISINRGHDITGGTVENISKEDTYWGKILLAIESSLFGGSFAKFRRKLTKPCYVSTLPFACYKRCIYDVVGEYNEKLVRTEDNDMHYRMRKAGFKFYFTPTISSVRFSRSSFNGLFNQKYLNGYWIGRTLFISPCCISLYHLVPLGFVLFLIASIVLFYFKLCIPILIFTFCAYIIINIIMTLSIVKVIGIKPIFLVVPFIFLILHIGYGVGTIMGIIGGIGGAIES